MDGSEPKKEEGGKRLEGFASQYVQMEAMKQSCKKLGVQHIPEFLAAARSSQVPMEFDIAVHNLIGQSTEFTWSHDESSDNFFRDIAKQLLDHDFPNDNEAAYAITYASAISVAKRSIRIQEQTDLLTTLAQKGPPKDITRAIEMVQMMEELESIGKTTQQELENQVGIVVYYENMVTNPPPTRDANGNIEPPSFQPAERTEGIKSALDKVKQIVEIQVSDRQIRDKIKVLAQT